MHYGLFTNSKLYCTCGGGVERGTSCYVAINELSNSKLFGYLQSIAKKVIPAALIRKYM